jgi:hypothetical protein
LTFRPVVTAAAASASSSLLRARLTLDIYGHLFPQADDSEELAAAERALLG